MAQHSADENQHLENLTYFFIFIIFLRNSMAKYSYIPVCIELGPLQFSLTSAMEKREKEFTKRKRNRSLILFPVQF